MLCQKETYPDGTTIGIWKVEEPEDELLSCFNEKREEYQAYISRFTSPGRKLEFLAVRCLLKELTGYENGIYYKNNGSPSLVDNKLKISISHTKGYASVITHPDFPVGIDIEQRKDRILKLKHKFLSEKELENLDSKNETVPLLLYWSAKETMFKMMGETSVDFIDHLHVQPFKVAESGAINCFETKSVKKQHFSLNYQVAEEYVLVWGRISD